MAINSIFLEKNFAKSSKNIGGLLCDMSSWSSRRSFWPIKHLFEKRVVEGPPPSRGHLLFWPAVTLSLQPYKKKPHPWPLMTSVPPRSCPWEIYTFHFFSEICLPKIKKKTSSRTFHCCVDQMCMSGCYLYLNRGAIIWPHDMCGPAEFSN